MTQFTIREEVVNVILAELLHGHGLFSVPEAIRKSLSDRSRNVPDVLVGDLQGIRVAIEGRFETSSHTAQRLLEDTRSRVENGIAPVCVAALYPRALRSIASLPDIRQRLQTARMRFRVVSETNDGSWILGSIADVAEALRRSYEMLVTEDTVGAAVEELDSAIDKSAEITIQTMLKERFREVLRIPRANNRIDFDEDMKACRIACLTLANAMIFQQVLSGRNGRVRPIASTLDQTDVAAAFHRNWSFITKEIDYLPIFTTADEIVTEMIGSADGNNALRILAASALRITVKRAALRHDLMGRIYHLLLKDAKYFGAFYTTIPAAALLAKLAIKAANFSIDWSKPEQIDQLRFADVACGTGTLLKAAVQTIVDNHVRAAAEAGEMPRVDAVHKQSIEKVVWGVDVVPSAIHLAGAALALHDPDVEIDNMNLYTLPTAGATSRLGSIDLFIGREIPIQADLFGAALAPKRQQKGGQIETSLDLPMLDLCIMNPPFTRSVGGNLLFGHVSEDQRKRMQGALKRLMSREGIPANVTAGLGSVFAALGNRLLKEEGVIALVLPRALLSGIAWSETRALIGNNYHVQHIVVSHEPNAWNFSENTELSECLVIAKKSPVESLSPTKVVNLWRKPTSSIEALSVAAQIEQSLGASLDSSGTDEVRTLTKKYGEVIRWPAREIRNGNWGEAAAFAQTELARVAYFLGRGSMYIPGAGTVARIPTLPLGAIAMLGPDRRDIHDAFALADEKTEFGAVWGHDTEEMTSMAVAPQSYLRALSRSKNGRPKRDAHLMWSRAGRVLIAERLWLTTTRVLALRSRVPVLSNTWWPVSFRKQGSDGEEAERGLVLWLNSTLGIISLLSARVETRGAWIELKKPIVNDLRVLNLVALRSRQREALSAAFDRLQKQPLRRISSLGSDPVRAEIDAAIGNALGVSAEMAVLREMLEREPIMSNHVPDIAETKIPKAAVQRELFAKPGVQRKGKA